MKCRMRFSVLAVSLVLLIVTILPTSPAVQAQKEELYKQSFQWHFGETGKVIHDDPFMFLSSGASVLCFQKTLGDFQLIRAIPTPSLVQDIAINDEFLFIGTKHDGLIIYNRNFFAVPAERLYPGKNILDISLTDDVLVLSAAFDGLFALYTDDLQEFFHLTTKSATWKSIYHNETLYAIDGLANVNLLVIKLPIPKRDDEEQHFFEGEADIAVDFFLDKLDQGLILDNQEPTDNSADLISLPEEKEKSAKEELLELLRNQPSHLATINRGNKIHDIAIDQNLLFIADGIGGLAIYDIEDPQNIKFQQSFTLSDLAAKNLRQDIKETQYLSLAAFENLLFASGQKELHIFTIKNKNLTLAAAFNLAEMSPLSILAEPKVHIGFQDSYLTISSDCGKTGFFEYTPPDKLIKYKEFDLPAKISNIVFDEGRIFIGTECSSIWEIPLHYHATPFNTVKVDVPGPIQDLVYEGDYVYAATGLGVAAINVSRANRPTLVSFIPFPYPDNRPDIKHGWVEGISLNNDYIYAAAGGGGLWVIDYTSPHTPRTSALFSINSNINKTEYDPDYKRVYAYGHPYSGIFSTFNSATPTLLKRIETKGNTGIGAAMGHYLYVGLPGVSATESYSVQVLEVLSPYNPKIITEIEFPSLTGDITAVSIADNIAAVVDDEVLLIYNIANPFEPKLVQTIKCPDRPTNISIHKNMLAVSTYNSGLLLFELIADKNR